MQLTCSSGTLKAIFVTVRIWAGVWLYSWLEKMEPPPHPAALPLHLMALHREEAANIVGAWCKIASLWCLNRNRRSYISGSSYQYCDKLSVSCTGGFSCREFSRHCVQTFTSDIYSKYSWVIPPWRHLRTFCLQYCYCSASTFASFRHLIHVVSVFTGYFSVAFHENHLSPEQYGDCNGMVAKFLKTELKPNCERLNNGYLN